MSTEGGIKNRRNSQNEERWGVTEKSKRRLQRNEEEKMNCTGQSKTASFLLRGFSVAAITY